MATPTTRDELFELIRKSGVLKPEILEKYLAEHPNLPAEPKAIVSQMVQTKLLTQFQAKLLLAGRYKGFRLGAYILLEQLGQGGMGAVYLAEHETLHRKAAIKVLPPGGNKITVERFLREARAVAALDHPNIVRMHDVGREGEVHFLVMEYVEGQTLDKLVTSTAPLPAQRAVEYVSQACAGLQHAHERGFIHRDIKPANLILAKDGTIKILDMGLARSSEKADQLTEMLDAGAIVGTADYISPEQAMNDPNVDIRTDIYSLGATFFAIVTGHPPFDGHTASKLLQHQVKDAPSVTSLDRTFPKGLSAVIAKMMAKKPSDRYETPSEVITALQPWQNESAKLAAGLSQTKAGQSGKLSRITGKHAIVPKKKKNRGMLYAILGGVSAALLLGIGITVALALSDSGHNAVTKGLPTGTTLPTQETTSPTTEATKPAPATQPIPSPTIPTPPKPIDPPVPQDGKIVYKLDLGEGIPVTITTQTYMTGTTGPKSHREIGRKGSGELPTGWVGRSYTVGSEVETEIATVDGSPAMGLRTTVAGDPTKQVSSGILVSPNFVCPSGFARVKIEYQTVVKTGSSTLKYKPDGSTALEFCRLVTPKTSWTTYEQVVDLKQKNTGAIEILPGGKPNEMFWIRNLVVTEANQADLPKKK
jgi:serine/threonine protein kinase